MALLLHDPAASWLLGAAVLVLLVGEVAATYLGQGRDGERRLLGSLYRLLRHPAYAGLFLSFGGLGLAFGSWVSAVVALVIVFAGMLPRIRVEERALARAFGVDYSDYAGSTARVLPYVW
jgi:protein-S-isoprenylcysteine O-methyltransferase Ste14